MQPASIQLGTVGEWLSSLAVIVAVAALVFEVRKHRRDEERRRYEELTRVVRHVYAWPGRRMRDNAGNWFQEVRLANTSDQTVRSLTAYVEFPQLRGMQFEAQFPGPLRPTPNDSVNVFYPNDLADLLELPTDERRMDDATATALGREALVSARFEDHEGRMWLKHQNGHFELLDRTSAERP